MRAKLNEERRARTIQRHLDQADMYEAKGNIDDAITEYQLALAEGATAEGRALAFVLCCSSLQS